MQVPKCAWVAVCLIALAQAQQVTDTKLVDYGKGQQVLRKINGRWWSQDNREVYPPGKDGIFWQLDSKPGVVDFFHHRPFQLNRAESLQLWMTPETVKATLGPPNRNFGNDGHGFWYYYASNGTKLEVRFMDGVVGEAKYTAVGEKSWPVASVERELAGRDIYKLLQERAGKRSEEWLATKREASRSEALRRGMRWQRAQPSTVVVDAAEPQAPPKKTIVSADALAAVTSGTTRENVLSKLGEPSSRFAIAGDEGFRESFTYHLESGEAVAIRLVDGKVVK